MSDRTPEPVRAAVSGVGEGGPAAGARGPASVRAGASVRAEVSGAPDPGRRIWVLRVGGLSARGDVRVLVVGALLLATALAIGVRAVLTGDLDLGPAQAWRALTDPDAGFTRTVVLRWRLPRVLAALLFGAALGVSGAVFQGLTGNPLASPDVIGFTAGSYTGVLVVLVMIGGGYRATVAGALIGGVGTALAVYRLAAVDGGVSGFRLLIVGIGASAMLTAANTYLILRADLEVAMNAAVWGAGSLAGTGWTQVLAGGAASLTLILAVVALAPALAQLGLGEDAAATSGVPVRRVRLLLVLLGVGLVAVVTAAAGPIAFVALVAPHLAHRLARTGGVSVPAAAVTGALLLVAADHVAAHLLPTALPVGLVTLVIGGVHLIGLLAVETRRHL